MKKLALIAMLSILSTPAFSQGRGVSTEDFNTGIRTRHGTYCKLAFDGDTVYDGLCTIAIRENTTVIDIGRAKYRIVRDPFDKTEGEFFRVDNNNYYGKVYARDSCWKGASVRFCAR